MISPRIVSATGDRRKEPNFVTILQRLVSASHLLIDGREDALAVGEDLLPDTATAGQLGTQIGNRGRRGLQGLIAAPETLAQTCKIQNAGHVSSSQNGRKATSSPGWMTRRSGMIARPLAQVTELNTPDERLGCTLMRAVPPSSKDSRAR